MVLAPKHYSASEMTYIVSGGVLSSTHSITHQKATFGGGVIVQQSGF